eukprot:scaffold109205_cov54-Attheya_sp.AAC.5
MNDGNNDTVMGRMGYAVMVERSSVRMAASCAISEPSINTRRGVKKNNRTQQTDGRTENAGGEEGNKQSHFLVYYC